MSSPIRRKRTLLEQGGIWAIIGMVGTGGIIAFAVGNFLRYWTWRGHTYLGLALGLLAILLMLASAFYSARKRALQETAGGSMVTWLHLHVWFGVLSLVAALAHAGFGALMIRPSTGWLLMIAFAVLMGSGVVWRIFYEVAPARFSKSLRNYSVKNSRTRAERHLAEVHRLTAGAGDDLQEAAKRLLDGADLSSVTQGRWTDEDRTTLAKVADLAQRRSAHLDRIPGQQRATLWLQGWRLLHLPAVLAVLVLIPIHVLSALEVKPVLSSVTYGYAPSESCADCHAQIFDEWSHSMHAHALKSPVTIVQNNLFVRKNKDPNVERVCVNCHGPAGVAVTKQALLPLKGSLLSSFDPNEGVGCGSCHQFDAQESYPNQMDVWGGRGNPLSGTEVGFVFPNSGLGGLDDFQDNLLPGWTYLGKSDASGNSEHINQAHPLYDDRPHELCASCHNVHVDRTSPPDNVIKKGEDLVLQTLHQEWEQYTADGGDETCADCHMEERIPTVDEAWTLLNQDRPNTRTTRSHHFAGVDYLLDADIDNDDPKKTLDLLTQRPERQKLLEQAARFKIAATRTDGDKVEIDVEIESLRMGHNLPSGFAFARQMWVELIVTDSRDKIVFSSGVLTDDATSDLCDAATMAEPQLKAFVKGCAAPDPQLVSYQLQLVNNVEGTKDVDHMGNIILQRSKTSQEIYVQEISAGAVARTRPIDGKKIVPLLAVQSAKVGTEFEGANKATWTYQIDKGGLKAGSYTVEAKLRFRNLPPYFLLAMARDPDVIPKEDPEIEPLIKNLQVIDMKTASPGEFTLSTSEAGSAYRR